MRALRPNACIRRFGCRAIRFFLVCCSPALLALPEPVLGQSSGADSQADTAPKGVVHGQVLAAESRLPISRAVVEIRQGGRPLVLLTDENGRYRAAGLGEGPVAVRAEALGRAALRLTIMVPAGHGQELDLTLERKPVVMPELFAEHRAYLEIPGLIREGFRQEGETEINALAATPGVAEWALGQRGNTGDSGHELYVRGGATDFKMVTIDGASVYAPFHLSGLMDAFPDGVLENATLYTGGTPARLDGGLFHVLELEIRKGDSRKVRSAGAIDLLSATVRVEGPLTSRGRWLVSTRNLHGLGSPVSAQQNGLPFAYGDALGRFDYRLGNGSLSTTWFWNRERVELLAPQREPAAPHVIASEWGNFAGSATYKGMVGDGLLTLRGTLGHFATTVPITRDDGFAGVATGGMDRTTVEATYDYDANPDFKWQVGWSWDTHETNLDQRDVFDHPSAGVRGFTNSTATWAEASWDIGPNMDLRTGLRASYFAPIEDVRLAPRATATWASQEGAELWVSAGRFYQIVRGPESVLSSDLTGPSIGRLDAVLDQGLDERPILGVAGASHLVVGLNNKIADGFQVGLEGNFKAFQDIPDYGQLWSSGADIWVQATEGPVRGWFGYSLSWAWSSLRSANEVFTGRQLLSLGLSTELRGFDLGVQLAHGAGLPFAVADDATGSIQADDGASEPPPAVQNQSGTLAGSLNVSYMRLDVEISRRWLTRVGRTPTVIAPYLRLMNGLDGRAALFYQGSENAVLGVNDGVPVIAVLGVGWSF